MKRILSLFFCLALVLSLVPAVLADSASVQSGWLEAESALIFVGKPGSKAAVQCGGTELPAELSTAGAEEIPVTYYCMVDASSTYSSAGVGNQKSQAIDALLQISSRMRSCDRMFLGIMGKSFTVTELIGTGSERDAGIKELDKNWASYVNYNTDLFANVDAALEKLTSDSSITGVRCLVVLTDGVNRGDTSVTREKLTEDIAGSDVFVAWMGLLLDHPDTGALLRITELEQTNAGAMAGLVTVPVRDKITVVQAADQIVDLTLDASAIIVGTDDIPRTGETVTLTVSLDGGETQIKIPTASLPALPVVETEPVTIPLVTEPGASLEPEESQPQTGTVVSVFGVKLDRTSLALLCVAAAAIAVLAVMSILNRIRMNIEYAKMDSMDTDTVFGDDSETFSDEDLQDRLHAGERDIFEELSGIKTMDSGSVKSCRVGVCEQDTGTMAVRMDLEPNESRTFGRSARADFVLNPDDMGMSGVHFELHWDGRSLYMRDKNSTNGTIVNGISCKPQEWVRLEDDAEIGAGAGMYRIMIGVIKR